MMPPSITLDGEHYKFQRLLGEGGTGTVGLYNGRGGRDVVMKVAYCNALGGEERASREARHAVDASSGRCTLDGQPYNTFIRTPLDSRFLNGCSYSVYEYAPQNLAGWLADNPRRRIKDVTSIFNQIIGMLRCLREKGYFYNDLKPSNLLVWSRGGAPPLVKIGDLGGIDPFNDSQIFITKSRIPPKMLKGLSWLTIEPFTSFILGELLLQLLLKSTKSGQMHTMDNFLYCLQGDDADVCIEPIISNFSGHLADGLSMEDEHVKRLASLAIALLGYKGLSMTIAEASAFANL
jgi:serine/threonine protein kinase